jgi:hypothetical protein
MNDFAKRISGKSLYSSPYTFHRFLEEDPRLTDESFPYIQIELSNGNMRDQIRELYRKSMVKEKRAVYPNDLTKLLNTYTIDQLFEQERITFYQWSFERQKNTNFLNNQFVHYRCFELLFNDYSDRRNSMFSDKVDQINQCYSDQGIDLRLTDSQFLKYGLLSLGRDMELLAIDNPRIYDKRVNTTFFIRNVSRELAELLDNWISKNYVSAVSFRMDNEWMIENRFDKQVLLEEVERGKVFSFEGLGKVSITKLYSVHMDTLWVTIDESNITFEEIPMDFDTTEEHIVTQVVHLEYGQESGDFYINHIDHEYIFYTVEEFAIRQSNPKQKGEGAKRLKSFKVDDSRIPFYIEEQFTLYRILDQYFTNKELLKEYFEQVIDA